VIKQEKMLLNTVFCWLSRENRIF